MLDVNLIITELCDMANMDYNFTYDPEQNVLKFEKIDTQPSTGLLGIDTYHIKNIWINLKKKSYRVTGTLYPEELTMKEHLVLHKIFKKLFWFKLEEKIK